MKKTILLGFLAIMIASLIITGCGTKDTTGQVVAPTSTAPTQQLTVPASITTEEQLIAWTETSRQLSTLKPTPTTGLTQGPNGCFVITQTWLNSQSPIIILGSGCYVFGGNLINGYPSTTHSFILYNNAILDGQNYDYTLSGGDAPESAYFVAHQNSQVKNINIKYTANSENIYGALAFGNAYIRGVKVTGHGTLSQTTGLVSSGSATIEYSHVSNMKIGIITLGNSLAKFSSANNNYLNGFKVAQASTVDTCRAEFNGDGQFYLLENGKVYNSNATFGAGFTSKGFVLTNSSVAGGCFAAGASEATAFMLYDNSIVSNSKSDWNRRGFYLRGSSQAINCTATHSIYGFTLEGSSKATDSTSEYNYWAGFGLYDSSRILRVKALNNYHLGSNGKRQGHGIIMQGGPASRMDGVNYACYNGEKQYSWTHELQPWWGSDFLNGYGETYTLTGTLYADVAFCGPSCDNITILPCPPATQ